MESDASSASEALEGLGAPEIGALHGAGACRVGTGEASQGRQHLGHLAAL